jgi:hypothetical protein
MKVNIDNAVRYFARTASIHSGEVKLFGVLIDALKKLSGNGISVAEYHGNSHQVVFGVNFNKSKIARCELADLAIVVVGKSESRFLLLQCKNVKGSWAHSKINGRFKLDYSQYYLLSRRPYITGVGLFCPPGTLLRDAILPSIGTYGVFYNDGFQVDMFSVAAGEIAADAGRSVMGSINIQNEFRVHNGFSENLYSCCMEIFLSNLLNFKIGTPIMKGIGDSAQESNIIKTKMLIAATIRGERLGSDVVQLVDFGVVGDDNLLGFKNLVVIRNDG